MEQLQTGSRFGPEDDAFELGKEIGSGAAGRVYECVRVWTREAFAVKIMNLQRLRLLGDFDAQMVKLDREVYILQELTHPKIVGLHKVHRTSSCVFLVMELVRGGELFDRIVQNRCLSEVEARYVFRQLLEGVGYMHTRNVIHRDLKPENILIASTREAEPPETGSLHEVKIADFGLSKVISDETTVAKTFVGTPQYWAPEVLSVKSRGGTYTQAVDYWSLGAVLFVMLSGRYPFDGKKMPLEDQIRTAAFNMSTQTWQRISNEAKDMVRGLLRAQPAERFDLQACLAHPWVCGRTMGGATNAPASAVAAAAAMTGAAGAGLAAAATLPPPPPPPPPESPEQRGPQMITDVPIGCPTTVGAPIVSHPSNSTDMTPRSVGSGGKQLSTPGLSQEPSSVASVRKEMGGERQTLLVPRSEPVAAAPFSAVTPSHEASSKDQHETIFCLNELLKLQVSIAGSLEMAALAFRHSDIELTDEIKKTFWLARDLSKQAVNVVSKYATVAEEVSSKVLPDLELAVQEKEPSLAVSLLGMVKDWVFNMKTDGQEIQLGYHGLQESVHRLIQRAQHTKLGADLRLTEMMQTAESPSQRVLALGPSPTAANGSVASGGSGGKVASAGSPTSNNAVSFAPVAAEDGHSHLNVAPFSMNGLTRQLFEQLGSMQTPKAIEDQPAAAGNSMNIGVRSSSAHVDSAGGGQGQFTHVDGEAWKQDVLDLLFMAPGILRGPKVESVVGSFSEAPSHSSSQQSGRIEEALVRYVPAAAPSTAPDIEAMASSSAALLRALRELKRVDEILEGCSAFWAHMDGTVQKLAQMKEHTERLVNYAANSKPLRDRFEQRLGEYTKFWLSLERLCRQYCLDYQASAQRMYEVIREMSDATDAFDTAQSARMGRFLLRS